MKILVTGATGFIGKNLVLALNMIKEGKDKSAHCLTVSEVYEYGSNDGLELLDSYCASADFVFHLAGVNHPDDAADYMRVNCGLTVSLTGLLEKHGNRCPVMLASSVQASLLGRYDNEYGRSKRAAEEELFAYGLRCGSRTLIYRFPNVFGKWCRPDYNSAVATFCHNRARGLPIEVTDPTTALELLYIDDLVAELIAALKGEEKRCDINQDGMTPRDGGRYCYVPTVHSVTLGELCGLIDRFAKQPQTLALPAIPKGSFEKKLYSTYLSYLPEDKMLLRLDSKWDARGSFTELLKPEGGGQLSVNVTKPLVTKGLHWHASKWEMFTVVSGEGLIRQRKIGTNKVIEHRVSGDRVETVYILPGYTHSITNLSDTKDLVTLMWANEAFDEDFPDTFFEEV